MVLSWLSEAVAAVQEARRPPNRTLTERKRTEVLAVLAATVPRSHPLFATLLPEKQICVQYEVAALREAQRKRSAQVSQAQQQASNFASWEEHQAAKFGVAQWQRDDQVDACTLCSEPFRWTGGGRGSSEPEPQHEPKLTPK